jgi:hypothetical protein
MPRSQVTHTGGANWQTRDNKLEGGKWQEAHLLHFLVKWGAEKAQLAVFGCFEFIGIVFKGIWRLHLYFFLHSIFKELKGA